MGSSKLFIAVAGNIGTGKTTLTHLLSERFGWKAYYEAVKDNPYLEDFYADMERWSFPLQIYFLTNRFKVHNEIVQGSASAIQDRCIYEDAEIFARNLHESKKMDDRDYASYEELYKKMLQYIHAPDLVIYLRKSVPKLREYIALRGRDFEKNIDPAYLAQLNKYYEDWIQGYTAGRVLILESDGLDFVANPQDFETIAERVAEALVQKDLFSTRTR